MKKIIQIVMFLSLAGFAYAYNISDKEGDILGVNTDGSINANTTGSTVTVTSSSSTLNATIFQGAGEDFDVTDLDVANGLKNIVISSGVITIITDTVTVRGFDFDIRDLTFAQDKTDTTGSTVSVRAINLDIRDLNSASDSVNITGSTVNVYQSGRWKSTTTIENVVTITDDRYSGKISTHTAGRITSSGNIPTSAFDITAWAFYSDGADSTVTGLGGISYCLDGIGNSSPPLELHFASPTIAITLGSGATFYWELWGKL